MYSFEHYTLWDEALQILRSVVEDHKLVVIPEAKRLVEPRIDTFTAVTPEVEALLATHSMLQLEGPFTKYPLELTQRDSGPAVGTYYVSWQSGPRIRWSLPAVTNDTPPRLTCGSITILKHYQDPETKAFEAPSDELEAAFKAVVATIKSQMTKVTLRKGEAVWVGKQAKTKLDAGEVTLG
jgi:hypothetical protein